MISKNKIHISHAIILALSLSCFPTHAGAKTKLAGGTIVIAVLGAAVVYAYRNDPDMQKSIQIVKEHLGAITEDKNIHTMLGKIKKDAASNLDQAEHMAEDLLKQGITATVKKTVHVGGVVVEATREGLKETKKEN